MRGFVKVNLIGIPLSLNNFTIALTVCISVEPPRYLPPFHTVPGNEPNTDLIVTPS